MHKTLTILLFLLLFLAACRPVRYPQVLLEADSLASACPDSAVALLRGLQAEMAGERKAVQIYYRLLCVKAQDKAYIPHTSDSAVQAVLRYYEGHRDRRHLPEAYYYAGRVASDLGDAPQALDYFDKALEAMPRDGMLPLRSKVLSQMGTLFYRQGMYPEALEMYKGSLKSDSVLGDSVGIIANRLNMSLSYKSLGKQDSMRIFALSAHLLNRNMQRPPWHGLTCVNNNMTQLACSCGKPCKTPTTETRMPSILRQACSIRLWEIQIQPSGTTSICSTKHPYMSDR